MPLSRGKKIILIVAAVVIVLILPFLLIGPPKLLAKSDSPGFCAGCHVMEFQFETWRHTGAHRRIRCVDCHLPNQNLAAHYVGKAISGVKDAVAFYSGHIPDPIVLTGGGAKILRDNCVRCHEELVSMVRTERNCWDCHRGTTHRRSGAMETR